MDQERLHEFMVSRVPFNKLLDIRITAVTPDTVEVQLTPRPELLNHVETLHAAVQFGLAEATSGSMIVAAFHDLIEASFVPLAVEATIHYRRPAQGTLRANTALSQERQSEIRTQLAQDGRIRFPLTVQIFNAEHIAVTELEITWIILKPRDESSARG